MKVYLTIFTSFLCFVSSIQAQNTFSSIVLDSLSQKPVEYASIYFSAKNGVITNSNGEFNITIRRDIKATDSLVISCLGYEEKRIALLNFNKDIIYLNQKSVDLDEVFITNKEYTIDEIIENMLAVSNDDGKAGRELCQLYPMIKDREKQRALLQFIKACAKKK